MLVSSHRTQNEQKIRLDVYCANGKCSLQQMEYKIRYSIVFYAVFMFNFEDFKAKML